MSYSESAAVGLAYVAYSDFKENYKSYASGNTKVS